jgi:hypothetical protein
MAAREGTPVRYISPGNRELRQYQGYWYIRLNDVELQDWPGVHWGGYVLIHKYKFWKRHGDWYAGDEARYYYADGDRDNIRLTNIAIKEVGTPNWL